MNNKPDFSIQCCCLDESSNDIDNKDIPTIKFMRHPRMAGFFWSDATPVEYGGSGVPIPEHEELYKKM